MCGSSATDHGRSAINALFSIAGWPSDCQALCRSGATLARTTSSDGLLAARCFKRETRSSSAKRLAEAARQRAWSTWSKPEDGGEFVGPPVVGRMGRGRLIGWANPAPTAKPRTSPTFRCRVFWLMPHDRDSRLDSETAKSAPSATIDPCTLEPRVQGCKTERASQVATLPPVTRSNLNMAMRCTRQVCISRVGIIRRRRTVFRRG
ncbi:DUF6009 family protein [Streptomyces sp. SAI-135]|uniref:DUF6009 family protein n=2 Tax=Streptomyces TaxID=1883 RepID=UPI0032AF54F3